MKIKPNSFSPILGALILASVPSVQAVGAKDAILQPAPKTASDDEWRFSFTPYFWLPSVNLDVSVPSFTVGKHTLGGDFSINQPWWDTLSNFSSDFYVLSLDGRFEAWKGNWGGLVDGYWIFGKFTIDNSNSELVLRDNVTGTISSSLTNRFDAGQVNFGPQYLLGTAPLSDSSCVNFILYGGGRVNWIGNELDGTLNVTASKLPDSPTSQIDFSNSASRVFIEPMVGLKSIWHLGDNVIATLRGDVGGFGWVEQNRWDCDLEASLGWTLSQGALVSLGYRARGQWANASSSDGKISSEGWFYGPEFGVTWIF